MNLSDPPVALRDGPLPAYRARVAAGDLASDPAQTRAAEQLQRLWSRLRDYNPAPMAESDEGGLLGRLWRRKKVDDQEERPHGLYIVGEVGRGKSMLMDLFFAAARVERKQRIHFHQFMQDAHKQLHSYKRAHPETEDPIPPLADAVAARAALLCFDEFQVNDIADAMILGRLFEALFKRGVVVVATSNTTPDNLFKGQPGRDAFLPFIALLKRTLDVMVLESARDYRRAVPLGTGTWLVPADAAATAQLDRVFATLANGDPPAPRKLTVMGRMFAIPAAAEGVARFDFQTLCGTALGAGDYLALATHYTTLVLDRVPRLGPENHNEARRFITLVDALYEHRVKLIASAEAEPDRLYEQGEGARAFERTASRLVEMQSDLWRNLPHLP
jgi:cell division protein ZapE